MTDAELKDWTKFLTESAVKAIKDNVNFLKTETKAMLKDPQPGSIDNYRSSQASFLESYANTKEKKIREMVENITKSNVLERIKPVMNDLAVELDVVIVCFFDHDLLEVHEPQGLDILNNWIWADLKLVCKNAM